MDYVRLIKKERADIVLTYTIKPNVYGGFACQVTGTPYITNVTGLGTAIENGGIMQLLTTNLYKLGLRRAACVFFQNSNNRRFFMERKLIRAKPISAFQSKRSNTRGNISFCCNNLIADKTGIFCTA